jgi:hypothetical protein
MAITVYSLCAIASAICTYLLFTAYRRSRYKLLLWSSLCFAGLTLNNLALWLDKIAFPLIDLSIPRLSIALVSVGILLFGLIWEVE